MPDPAYGCASDVQDKVDEYFDSKGPEEPVSWPGLAVYLGMGKSTLYAYESGNCDYPDQEDMNFSEVFEKARLRIEEWMINAGMQDSPASMAKFVLERQYKGYKNQEIVPAGITAGGDVHLHIEFVGKEHQEHEVLGDVIDGVEFVSTTTT